MKRFNNKSIWIIILILVVAGVAGFALWNMSQSESDSIDSTQTSTQSEPVKENVATNNTEMDEAKTGTVITTGSSEFGTMLFNDKQQAIYIWEVEKTSKAECYDDCADAWPPVLTDGEPVAAGEVRQDLLGTTERSDGTTQVTYNDHPLYYYAHEGPGQVLCHNIPTHGGLWWVIQPNGIRAD